EADAQGRAFKWLAWLLAAAALGGAALYFVGRSSDNTAAASLPQESIGQAITTTPVIDVVHPGYDAILPGVAAATPGATNSSSSAARDVPLENAEALGNGASTAPENAVTGAAVAATAGSSGSPGASVFSATPTSAGARPGVPVSSGQRGLKPSGPSTPAKSNDHA